MTTKTRFGRNHGTGALLGIAGIVALAALFAPGDTGSAKELQPATSVAVTAPQASSPLLAAGMLGQAVVEFFGIGLGFGLLAFGASRAAAHHRENRHAATREVSIQRAAIKPLVVVAVPRIADATASEFDDAKVPSFLPVTSLTEAQVRMRRGHRRPPQQHAVPTTA